MVRERKNKQNLPLKDTDMEQIVIKIQKQYSDVLDKIMYYVKVDGITIDSHYTEEEAIKHFNRIVEAHKVGIAAPVTIRETIIEKAKQ